MLKQMYSLNIKATVHEAYAEARSGTYTGKGVFKSIPFLKEKSRDWCIMDITWMQF